MAMGKKKNKKESDLAEPFDSSQEQYLQEKQPQQADLPPPLETQDLTIRDRVQETTINSPATDSEERRRRREIRARQREEWIRLSKERRRQREELRNKTEERRQQREERLAKNKSVLEPKEEQK